jgi:hypothetical protein
MKMWTFTITNFIPIRNIRKKSETYSTRDPDNFFYCELEIKEKEAFMIVQSFHHSEPMMPSESEVELACSCQKDLSTR